VGEVVSRRGTNFGGGRTRERDWRPWGAHRRESAVSGRDFAVFAGAGVQPEQGRGTSGLSKAGAARRPAPRGPLPPAAAGQHGLVNGGVTLEFFLINKNIFI
jgi:hypothetical protein